MSIKFEYSCAMVIISPPKTKLKAAVKSGPKAEAKKSPTTPIGTFLQKAKAAIPLRDPLPDSLDLFPGFGEPVTPVGLVVRPFLEPVPFGSLGADAQQTSTCSSAAASSHGTPAAPGILSHALVPAHPPAPASVGVLVCAPTSVASSSQPRTPAPAPAVQIVCIKCAEETSLASSHVSGSSGVSRICKPCLSIKKIVDHEGEDECHVASLVSRLERRGAQGVVRAGAKRTWDMTQFEEFNERKSGTEGRKRMLRQPDSEWKKQYGSDPKLAE